MLLSLLAEVHGALAMAPDGEPGEGGARLLAWALAQLLGVHEAGLRAWLLAQLPHQQSGRLPEARELRSAWQGWGLQLCAAKMLLQLGT